METYVVGSVWVVVGLEAYSGVFVTNLVIFAYYVLVQEVGGINRQTGLGRLDFLPKYKEV